MSIVSQIALNLDILARNVARLQEQAAVLPPQDQIREVSGANKEMAQQTYFDKLSQFARVVGKRTEVVRLYVEHNAEALQKAADALQKRDGDTSLEARQAAAFIGAATNASHAPSETGASAQSRQAAQFVESASSPKTDPSGW